MIATVRLEGRIWIKADLRSTWHRREAIRDCFPSWGGIWLSQKVVGFFFGSGDALGRGELGGGGGEAFLGVGVGTCLGEVERGGDWDRDRHRFLRRWIVFQDGSIGAGPLLTSWREEPLRRSKIEDWGTKRTVESPSSESTMGEGGSEPEDRDDGGRESGTGEAGDSVEAIAGRPAGSFFGGVLSTTGVGWAGSNHTHFQKGGQFPIKAGKLPQEPSRPQSAYSWTGEG